jgi:hypothetical protein
MDLLKIIDPGAFGEIIFSGERIIMPERQQQGNEGCHSDDFN